ncbi:thymidylate kinase isoform X2 [Typha angustifolia]|uniref:thymidylate kinase isoform X2 n=1 Tax=Typha angustifolia TaxID=59011 RepID=UPI003C2BCA3C
MAVLSHLKIFSQALPQHALSCAHRQLGYTIYARASRTSRGAKLSCQHIKRSFPAVHMDNGHYNSARGSLIVLEGLDRSGKTSQCSNLLSYLRGTGLSVEAWRFPDRSTSIGQLISAYLANESQLDDKAIHLLFSANRWEKRALMENKLKSGITIVVDRYSYSGVAFSVAKGLDMGWCMALEMGLIAPDLVIFLDIPPEKAAERGGYGTERYEQLEFQRKVAKHYHTLCDASWEALKLANSESAANNLYSLHIYGVMS